MINKLLLITILIFFNNVLASSIDDRNKSPANDANQCKDRFTGGKYSADTTVKYCLKSCDKDNFESCAFLGKMMEIKGNNINFFTNMFHSNTEKYYALAIKNFEKSCSGKDHYGCSNLGFMYIDGKGVIKNNVLGKHCLKKAEKYLKKDCPRQTSMSMACASLSILYGMYYEKTKKILFDIEKHL
jgi:hypothetical protein